MWAADGDAASWVAYIKISRKGFESQAPDAESLKFKADKESAIAISPGSYLKYPSISRLLWSSR